MLKIRAGDHPFSKFFWSTDISELSKILVHWLFAINFAASSSIKFLGNCLGSAKKV